MKLKDLALFTYLNLAACAGVQTPNQPTEEPTAELQACQEYLATIQEITRDRLLQLNHREARRFSRENSHHLNRNPYAQSNLVYCQVLKAVMYRDLIQELDQLNSEQN